MSYRLRIIRLVPITGSGTYGSDNYGDNTYGARVTDTADLQRYEIVPVSGPPAKYPLMLRRYGDTEPPFECWLIAYTAEYEGVERSGVRMDLTDVASATMRLASYINSPLGVVQRFLPMEVILPDRLRLVIPSDTFQYGMTGPYRAVIQLVFNSGRVMTMPPDNSMTVIVGPNPGSEMFP